MEWKNECGLSRPKLCTAFTAAVIYKRICGGPECRSTDGDTEQIKLHVWGKSEKNDKLSIRKAQKV